MKWVPQVCQSTSMDVCCCLSPAKPCVRRAQEAQGIDRSWRNEQGSGGEEAKFSNRNTGVLVLARRLLSLTGSQRDVPEQETAGDVLNWALKDE